MKKFVEENVDVVSLFPIVTTRSTGAVLENAFGLAVQHKTCSGPLGGDQEIGGMISLGQVDGVLFFRDPLSAHPARRGARGQAAQPAERVPAGDAALRVACTREPTRLEASERASGPPRPGFLCSHFGDEEKQADRSG